VKELPQDFPIARELLVAHAIVVGIFFAQAGEAARVAAGQIVIDGSKIGEILGTGAFEVT